MDEQGYRFGVGVLVVASMVIAIILILFFGAAPNLFTDRYLVTIRFAAAPGVTSDTPVRKNGVQIGRVKSLKLLDEDGVDLTLELDSQYKVRSGELPQIATGSLITGDAVVEFIPPSQESLIRRFDGAGGSPQDGILDENEALLASTPLKDQDFLSGGRVAPDPFDALVSMQASFDTTLGAIEQAGNQVTALALDVRNMLGGGDGELQKIADQTEQTIANFNRTLTAIESLFDDPNLRSAIETVSTRLPDLIDNAEGVMLQTQDTLAAFEDVGRAAEGTMQNITEFTDPLGEQGEAIVGEVRQTIQNLDKLVVDLRTSAAQVNRIAARINSSDGTISKLIDDDQLYYEVAETLHNVSTLTRELRPIIQDIRVFSDKVARDPASAIDLRGAITGRPRGGIK